MTSSGRRRPPAQRVRDPERTRERILHAALAEFADKGYAGARVGEIADRAGVNKQLISYYFGGKAGLYAELTSGWVSGDIAKAEEGRSQSFVERAARYVPRTPEDRQFARLLAWDALTPGDGNPSGESRDRRMRHALAELQDRQAGGEVPGDLDPACLLLFCMGAASAPVVLPHVAETLTGEDPASEEFLARFAEQYERILARLLAVPSRPSPTAERA